MILKILLLWGGSLYGQTYEELVGKSYDYLENNDLLAAEMSLKEALRAEPANPGNYALLTNLGTIQRRQGKLDEALLSYTTALNRFPQNVMILENRAALYIEMNEPDKALNDYSLLLLSDSLNQDALYNRGMLYIQKKNFLWAEHDFNKILELNETTFYGRLGYAVLEKMRGNYDESERIYNYLIEKMPREWQLYKGRAELYFFMNKNGRAMADVNRLFLETVPDAELFVLRGRIRLAQNDRSSARKDFLKAKEMGYSAQVVDELLRLSR
ncbi:MAG: tetratricopeptide repeat protein [Tannerellaceae bacterium]|jgi:tetratricopeptide (TPR) repeat protein|nr:tetratricopeptide repeat protein [Tannerellaceae bacterium]